MTITAADTTRQSNFGFDFDFDLVAVDLYRDIHKGIRAELFDITATAGSIDPGDRCARVALVAHVLSVAQILDLHATHEDGVIDPVLQEQAPALAAQIADQHHALEARLAVVVEIAQSALDAEAADQRRLMHLLYLELTGFTSAYLAHQIVEERVVMPALEQAVGVERVIALHGEILSSIPPDEMARSLAFMLPAMNLDDRVEMLGGMRMSAPPEAFDAVVGLARSVLHHADFAAMTHRLGLA